MCRGRGTYWLNVLDDLVFDAEVFKHCLHHHVAGAKVLIRDGRVQVGDDAVSLKAATQKCHQD